MTLIEIMEYCNGSLLSLGGGFSMPALLSALYRGGRDVEKLADFLGELNFRTRADFDRDLAAWLAASPGKEFSRSFI